MKILFWLVMVLIVTTTCCFGAWYFLAPISNTNHAVDAVLNTSPPISEAEKPSVTAITTPAATPAQQATTQPVVATTTTVTTTPQQSPAARVWEWATTPTPVKPKEKIYPSPPRTNLFK